MASDPLRAAVREMLDDLLSPTRPVFPRDAIRRVLAALDAPAPESADPRDAVRDELDRLRERWEHMHEDGSEPVLDAVGYLMEALGRALPTVEAPRTEPAPEAPRVGRWCDRSDVWFCQCAKSRYNCAWMPECLHCNTVRPPREVTR